MRTAVRISGRLIRWTIWMILRARQAPAERPDEETAYLLLGRIPADDHRIRRALRRRGFRMPHVPDWLYGGGLHLRHGARLNGGLGMGNGDEIRERDYRAGAGAGNGMGYGGHIVYENERMRIYALAGVGGFGAGLNARRRDRNTQIGAGTGGLAARAGWAFEYRLPVGERFSLVIGWQMGALLAPLQVGWRGKDIDESIPAPRRVRPFFHLTLGVAARPPR